MFESDELKKNHSKKAGVYDLKPTKIILSTRQKSLGTSNLHHGYGLIVDSIDSNYYRMYDVICT